MPDFIPVEHDPFKFTPVENNPFAWVAEENPVVAAQAARETAAERTRRAVRPPGGRREGAATLAPEQAVMSLATLPRRAFGAAQQYGETGEYNPGPILEAATLPMGATPFSAPAGAVGAGLVKGTGSRLAQPPIGAQLNRELAPTEVFGEIGRGALPVGGKQSTGAVPAQVPRTLQNTPDITLQSGTIEAFLKKQGVPFRVEHSKSTDSLSTYYYVDTPTGVKKIRLSDHLGGYGENLDLRYGTSSKVALEKIAAALGKPLEKGAVRDVEIERLQNNLQRWPDSPASAKWKMALTSLGVNDIIKKYGIAGLSMLPPATAQFLKDKLEPVDHDPFQ